MAGFFSWGNCLIFPLFQQSTLGSWTYSEVYQKACGLRLERLTLFLHGGASLEGEGRERHWSCTVGQCCYKQLALESGCCCCWDRHGHPRGRFLAPPFTVRHFLPDPATPAFVFVGEGGLLWGVCLIGWAHITYLTLVVMKAEKK